MEYHSVVDIVKQILDQYDFPLTVRQIYYQLVSHYSFPNKQSTYTRLSKILVKARENGDIDEFKIADRSRDVYALPTYPNLETFYTHTFVDFLDNLKDYNRNLWLNQDIQVIVWIEKDALAEVVARASLLYQVPVFPSRGYASYTYIRSVWNRINMYKPLIVHINSDAWNKDLEQYNLEKQKLETLIPKIRETLLSYTKELTSL